MELRRFRRPLAAHLRHVFDYRVAPWGRWNDPKRRFEASALLIEKGERMLMADFASHLRLGTCQAR